MANTNKKSGCLGCFGILIVLGFLGLVGAIVGGNDKKDASGAPQSASTSTESSTKASNCSTNDLQCWGDRYAIAAGLKCKDPVEALAKYEVKWTDTWFESKFFRFRWTNDEHTAITMVGDRAKMSNGFGAFTNIIYECDLSVPGEEVLDVRARDGRLVRR